MADTKAKTINLLLYEGDLEGVIHANFAKKDTKSAMNIFLKEITGKII